MFDLVDISNFKIVSIPTLGYMQKLWLKDSTGIKWLLKYPGEKYPCDAVNEKICCEIAKIFNIPFQRVELCINDEGGLGCICRNFLAEGEALLHGGNFLGNMLNLNTSSPKFGENTDEQYTLQLILKVLNNCEQEFITTVLFDNLVGNIDRHDKNWALIRKQSGEYRLSPCYDYGLSFYQTKETETTWFQDIGFEKDGVVSFNNLFCNLCGDYTDITTEFMSILGDSDIIRKFEHIKKQIPVEFQPLIKHQFDFLVIRREKMLNIWRGLCDGNALS